MEPDFKILLKEHAFKATPRRIQLLGLLWREGKPLSVPEIARRLSSKINEVTLYRALEAFATARIIRRVDLGHAHAHYELQKTHHHHLVCVDCGHIEDIDHCPIPLRQNTLVKSKFVGIYSHNLEFFGTCKGCSKK